MSESEKVAPFFIHQEVEVIAEVKILDKIVTVDSNSYISRPENIEALLTVGTVGEIIDIDRDTILIYFFPGTHGIRIRVMKWHFLSRFVATQNIVKR